MIIHIKLTPYSELHKNKKYYIKLTVNLPHIIQSYSINYHRGNLTPHFKTRSIQKRHSNFMSALCYKINPLFRKIHVRY